MLQRIKKLSKPIKVVFVAIADFSAVFLAWYVFTNTAPNLKIFLINIGSTSGEFLEPGSLKTFFAAYTVAFIYLFNSGFYRSRIGSYESKLTLLRSVIGSFAYGITYSLSLYYIDGYKDLPIYFYVFISISSFVVIYAILNFIRDLASYVLYTKTPSTKNKKNILIYIYFWPLADLFVYGKSCIEFLFKPIIFPYSFDGLLVRPMISSKLIHAFLTWPY